jgi:hypothetical protein
VIFWLRLLGSDGGVGLVVAVPLWALLAAVTGVSADRLRQAHEEEASHAAELRHRALHDPLTGLANRELVLDRLEQALVRAERYQTKVAVLSSTGQLQGRQRQPRPRRRRRVAGPGGRSARQRAARVGHRGPRRRRRVRRRVR